MRYVYPAMFVEDERGGFSVTFPDFNIATQGESMGDGIEMGADALWLIIDDYLERGKTLPDPTFELLDEGTMVAISVEVDPREPLVSTKEAAKLLGVSGARVRQMIRSGQLDWRKRGRDNFVYLRSVEERLAASPKAGRPKKEASGSLPAKNADAKV